MPRKYNYLVTSDGKSLKEYNGEIYETDKDYPLKYKEFFEYCEETPFSLYYPKDFFSDEVREVIEKIYNAKDEQDSIFQNELVIKPKCKEICYALLECEHTPPRIVEQVIRNGYSELFELEFKSNKLNKKAMEVLSQSEASQIKRQFHIYKNAPLKWPCSDKYTNFLMDYCVPFDFLPAMYCKSESVVKEYFEAYTNPKSKHYHKVMARKMATNILSNPYMSDNFKNEILNSNIEYDISEFHNMTGKVLSEWYNVQIQTIEDLELNSTQTEEEKDMKTKAIDSIVLHLELGGEFPEEMQLDLLNRLQTYNWKNFQFRNLFTTLASYTNSKLIINMMIEKFAKNMLQANDFDAIYHNENCDDLHRHYIINYLTDDIINNPHLQPTIINYKRLEKLLSTVKMNNLLSQDLLRIKDHNIGLYLSKRLDCDEKTLIALAKSEDYKTEICAKITLNKNIPNEWKELLHKSISNTIKTIEESEYINIAPSLVNFDLDKYKHIRKEMLSIRDTVTSIDGKDAIKAWIDNADIVAKKQKVYNELGFSFATPTLFSDICYENKNEPINLPQEKIKDLLSSLTIKDINNIKLSLFTNWCAPTTMDMVISFYRNVDKYKSVMDAIKEVIEEKEKEKHVEITNRGE